MTFGRRLRELRRQRGLSQRELADLADIDFTYLSKIENDKTAPPSEKVIRKIAASLGANVDELITLAGKVPSDLARFISRDPEAVAYLRKMERKKRRKV